MMHMQIRRVRIYSNKEISHARRRVSTDELIHIVTQG
jgi:hypothetical protein